LRHAGSTDQGGDRKKRERIDLVSTSFPLKRKRSGGEEGKKEIATTALCFFSEYVPAWLTLRERGREEKGEGRGKEKKASELQIFRHRRNARNRHTVPREKE